MTSTPSREGKSALARRLKVHRITLDKLLSAPGAPAPDKAKKYDVREVADFIAEHKSGMSAEGLRALRAEELKLKIEALRRDLDRQANLVVTLAEVDELLTRIGSRLANTLAAQLAQVAPKLPGLAVDEIRERLDEVRDAVHLSMQTAVREIVDEANRE